ncbi:MAG: NADPH-dependent F420 reductase [Gammaproteobacteria bacterium]
MKVGFIGYGNMAEALGSRWAGKHDLFVGGRDASKARVLADKFGHGTKSGSEADAAAYAEVVVLATPHAAVFDAMRAAGSPGAFAGKVLLDINNPIVDFTRGDFLVKTFDGQSLAEAVAANAPAARVVKAFNMCQAKVWQMDPPVFDGRRLVTLFCGDDVGAKRQVATLIENIGCEPVDLGELKYARLLEPAAAIVIKFLFAGRDPHTVLNLVQPESKPIA